MRPLLFASIILLFSLHCQAAPLPSTSGNDFRRLCADVIKAGPPVNAVVAGDCLGFIEGVMDGIEFGFQYAQDKAGKKAVPRLFCRPEAADNEQIIRILLKFIDDNPKTSDYATVPLLVAALSDAFPCR